MSKYLIDGGKRLSGEIKMHGAKNSALPILAASLLGEESILHNCPRLSDVTAACNILNYLGCQTMAEEDTITVKANHITCCDIPDHLMREMRSSIVFLGAILTKCGRARISMPGGCELGTRPIDIHLAALEKMGVSIIEDHGYLNCSTEDGLKGCTLTLPFPSVGATENIILAAVKAKGQTVIYNAAREPEIEDLAGFLNACGASIKISDAGTIYINGVEKLKSAEYRVISDRIATATYLICAAITKGEINIKNTNSKYLTAVLPLLEEAGCVIKVKENSIYLKNTKRLKPFPSIRTMPYPGFPTDAQSPMLALASVADGTSIFVENIFENRYKNVAELKRMGAKIKLEGRVAIVEGVKQLHSAKVQCTDLRGGASLVAAALFAQGTSQIYDIRHIERGYQDMDLVLRSLGAQIKKV